jgi:hypothetical protein
VCTCGAQKVKKPKRSGVCWAGAGLAWCLLCVCVLSLKPFGLFGVAIFLCVVCGAPLQGVVCKALPICEGGARSMLPSVDVKSWIVCWCVCIGVGIGGKDGPALFDLGDRA